jgi:hypothetical protein
MSLSRIATCLDSTQIYGLETIAQTVHATSQDNFDKEFAQKIVMQKLAHSLLSYERNDEKFPYVIHDGENVLVMVSPRLIIPDQRKSSVGRFAREIEKELNGYDGIIAFAPFLMNGHVFRDRLKKELPIGFVNLAYDAGSLERRYRQNCQ